MANLEESNPAFLHAAATGGVPMSFDFPEDVLLCILSFLTPSEIGSFCCTSRRFVSLGRSDSRLWYALCDRRWGGSTQIKRWGKGKISYKLLYRTLSEWEDLIGFWRRSGQGTAAISSPSLVLFEWGPSSITGSRVSPSQNGTYGVVKAPFLWMSISQEGQIVNFIDSQGKGGDLAGVVVENLDDLGLQESDFLPVHVSFIGRTHLVVEENMGFTFNCEKNANGESSASVVGDDQGMVEDLIGTECPPPGSIQDRFMSEIYQYFANRTSPGADRRRQRRREKERQGRRKLEPEHFVKIVNCSPTASRPLQGLWKGISDDTSMIMEFYLVVYDETGGISCRKVWESSERERFSAHALVFWTTNAEFIEYPFSSEEEYIYDTRIHLRPNHTGDEQLGVTENEVVSHLLFINSSYDLVIPGTSANPRQAEGRIWQYRNGTFGFGFLRDNFIIDLKHITHNGCLLNTLYSDLEFRI